MPIIRFGNVESEEQKNAFYDVSRIMTVMSLPDEF